MSPVKIDGLPTVVDVAERTHKDVEFMDVVEETKDPTRHYRWVRCRKDESMLAVSQAKNLGYIIETDREGGPVPVTEFERRPDKAIVVGDAVLMSCPIGLFNRRMDDQNKRTEALLASTSATTERMAKEKGISIIKDADHNA